MMKTPSDINPGRLIGAAHRLVLKVGSALVADAGAGAALTARLAAIAQDIAAARTRGTGVVLVSSGAVALGRGQLGFVPPLSLEQKQASAATGQPLLMEAWRNALAAHDLGVAQLLLTLEDTEDRRRYLNTMATLTTLSGRPVVPIVNENDTTATAELRYGDNDRLAAHTAQMMGADLLVLLSDIDGLYTADPRRDPAARHLPVVDALSDDHLAIAGPANAALGVGSGGMATKLAAAQIATRAGIAVLIADGTKGRPLAGLCDGAARASLFLPTQKRETARRQWIAGRQKPVGTVTVDNGAAQALARGKSLLPAGITDVSGAFRRGDLVAVIAADGTRIAAGLSAFDAGEVHRIKGCHSREISDILGEARQDTVIHRNDLVLENPAPKPGL